MQLEIRKKVIFELIFKINISKSRSSNLFGGSNEISKVHLQLTTEVMKIVARSFSKVFPSVLPDPNARSGHYLQKSASYQNFI